jgi:hypothetical protein
MSVKIMFRGLMLFHKLNGVMEIGVLNHLGHGAGGGPHNGPPHVPRIITTRQGVISSIYDLRIRPESRPPGQPGHFKHWEIVVTDPARTISTTEGNGAFDRLTHEDTTDYRWIADLEGDDLHGIDLTDYLDTPRLPMVLTVRNGHFYTQQLSKPLLRKTESTGEEELFGRAAEVTGCDIPINGGEVQLKVNGNVVFRFKDNSEDDVVYEFSNAPPDVLPDRVYSANEPGHFQMYYRLFRSGPTAPRHETFSLIPQVQFAPAPDPALCGAAGLGRRSEPIGG